MSQKPERPDLVDESAESEITIQPDGRIFAFGITRELVALLETIPRAVERVASEESLVGRTVGGGS